MRNDTSINGLGDAEQGRSKELYQGRDHMVASEKIPNAPLHIKPWVRKGKKENGDHLGSHKPMTLVPESVTGYVNPK